MWLSTWSYLTPTALSMADVGRGVAAMRSAAEPLRALPPEFDASTHEVTQGSATSKDGTQVPYYVVRPKAAAGPVPTILYGYGGAPPPRGLRTAYQYSAPRNRDGAH